MSLRKSPTRTPALLAANRANAEKSTGPRTPEGKNRVALSALRNGLHTPNFLSALGKSSRAMEEFSGLYRALYAALLPDKADETAMDLLKRTALRVWAMKQDLMRWAASRAKRQAWFAKTGGVFPAPEQIVIKRPGWRVRISLWVRRGRGRGRRRLLQTGAGWEDGRARLHVGVTVTASIGHPLLGCSSLGEVQEGTAPRVVFKLEPECIRKHKHRENVIAPSRIETPFSQGAAPTPQKAGSARAGLPRPDGVPGKPGATTPAERLALSPDQDPISRHLASTTGDLISWLRPENVALSGNPLSESEDLRSWVGGIAAKREKQLGPIPKKGLLPHQIG